MKARTAPLHSVRIRPAEVIATGLGLTSTVGLLGLVPLFIGSYVDGYSLSVHRAATLVTVEVAASIFTLVAAGRRRRAAASGSLAVIGALAAGASYSITAIAASFQALLICRVFSGMGVGLMSAAVNRSIARSAAAERLYAIGLTISGALVTVLLLVLPALAQRFGHWIPFASVALVFFLTAIVSSVWIRLSPARNPASNCSSAAASWRFAFPSHATAILMIGYFTMWVAFSMVWIFAERKANAVGMTPAITGLALSSSNVIGLLGSLLASRVSLRLGHMLPIVVSGLILVCTFLAIGLVTSTISYVAALVSYAIAFYFLLPYVFAVAVALDPTGNAPVSISAMPFAAHLISPVLGASTLAHGSFAAMGAVSAATMLLAVLLVAVTIRFLPRQGRTILA